MALTLNPKPKPLAHLCQNWCDVRDDDDSDDQELWLSASPPAEGLGVRV